MITCMLIGDSAFCNAQSPAKATPYTGRVWAALKDNSVELFEEFSINTI